MKKFKYTSVGTLTEYTLRNMGEEGWELIGYFSLQLFNTDMERIIDRPRYHFKREELNN